MKKLTCPDFDLIQLLKAILKEKPNHPVVKKFSHKITRKEANEKPSKKSLLSL